MIQISEILKLALFKDFKIICGEKYLDNLVNATVILEYESSRIEYDGYGYGYFVLLATVYKGNIIKNLIMDCQSYTKYRPNETTGGIFVSWRRKEELPTGA
uniref:hypothetical protein n=1 Tax=Roseburia faecis TaxID=301302 RepID=UPI004029A4BF